MLDGGRQVDHVAARVRDATTTGLLPTFFNPATGAPTNNHITYGARFLSFALELKDKRKRSCRRGILRQLSPKLRNLD